MVCTRHFSPALPAVLLHFAEQGQLGVQVFFVISGYIIPYSLLRAGWRFTGMGRFWLKRLVRLQPAYATALLLTFGLSSLAAFAKGEPPKISWLEMIQDFFYLGFPAENPVIWTLIVEMKAALAKSAYPELAAGLLCYLAIRHLPPVHFKLGIFLGAISYSLYLIHFPLGVKLLNLALPHTPQALRILWVPICLFVSIAAAYVLFRLVEKPSSERSQKIPLSERQASRRARSNQWEPGAPTDAGAQPLPPT